MLPRLAIPALLTPPDCLAFVDYTLWAMAGRFFLGDSVLGGDESPGDWCRSGEEDEALLPPGERFEKNWRPGLSRGVGVRSARSVFCPLLGSGSFCGDDSEDRLEPP